MVKHLACITGCKSYQHCERGACVMQAYEPGIGPRLADWWRNNWRIFWAIPLTFIILWMLFPPNASAQDMRPPPPGFPALKISWEVIGDRSFAGSCPSLMAIACANLNFVYRTCVIKVMASHVTDTGLAIHETRHCFGETHWEVPPYILGPL